MEENKQTQVELEKYDELTGESLEGEKTETDAVETQEVQTSEENAKEDTKEDAQATEQTKPESKTMVVCGRVYLRKEATVDSETLDVLEVGQTLEVLDTVDGWHKLEKGYVMEGFLALEGN